jgi:phospholipase/carboxylesterase
MITRRGFLALSSTALTLGVRQRPEDGHISAKLKPPTTKGRTGEHALALDSIEANRDGLLRVPPTYTPDKAAPLAVMLHGAGGYARRVSSLFSVAEDFGVILLIPESRGPTWDAVRGRYGPDIEFLDRALKYTFERCNVDGRRIAIGGFSDGATYGLSVGLASGDLFTHILACSPGFIIKGGLSGKPRIFISHGKADQILPIDTTSRRIVPVLQRANYAVTYREFEGPHSVPPEIAREAFGWFVGK